MIQETLKISPKGSINRFFQGLWHASAYLIMAVGVIGMIFAKNPSDANSL